MADKNITKEPVNRKRPPWLLVPAIVVAVFIVALPTIGRYRDATLLDATQRGDTRAVKRLLLAGGDVNPLLIAAIRRHHAEAVQLLLAHGALVTPDALLSATTHQQIPTIRLLVARDVAANHRTPEEAAALEWAAENGKRDLVHYIVTKGADVNAPIGGGATLLLRVLEDGNEDIIRFLLARGADINAQDQIGETALMLAAGQGNLPLIQLLVEHGAKVNRKTTGTRWADGNTALFFAVRAPNAVKIVKYLIARGADVNAKNDRGGTVLMESARVSKLDVVKLLLAHGADATVDSREGSALINAAGSRNLEMVRLLLAAGAPVNPKLGPTTPLANAAQSGSLDIVQLLVEKGADVNPIGENSTSPLISALNNRDLTVARYLRSKGAVFHPGDVRGYLIGEAAQNSEMMRFLLENGADINTAEPSGRTPLMDLCAHEYGTDAGRMAVDPIRVLLAHGANVNLKDRKGETALSLALAQNRIYHLRARPGFTTQKPGSPVANQIDPFSPQSIQRTIEASDAVVALLRKAGAK